MRKKKFSPEKSSKKEENMVNKKIIAVIAILLVAYLVINSLIPDEETVIQPRTEIIYQSCEERCVNNDECLNDCYINDINVAVLNSDINACNNIPHETSKQSCLDKVNLKLDKCDLIQDLNLKQICLENVQ